MKLRTLILFVLSIIVAAIVGKIVGSWTVERYVEPYQERYFFTELMPLAQKLADRYSNKDIDDVEQISDEVYKEYLAEVSIIGEIFEDDSIEEDDFGGVSYSPQGAFITVVLKDQNVIEIGPVSGSWFVGALAEIVELTILLLAIFITLYSFMQPLKRRVQSLLGPMPPGLGANPAPSSISLLKRLETDHAALKARVSELTVETEKRLDNQRDFLHGVAHEFRGPLARLRFATCLEDDTLIPTIDEITEEMEALVTEILQYSRFHHGLFELEYTTVVPYELIQEAISRITPMPPHLSIKIDSELQQVSAVRLDEALFLRCLLNLLLNACRFAKSKIEINGYLTDYQFVVNVDDDGPGIPPGKKKLIFEPFTRLDPSRSRESGGAGLGLAIVSGIVNRLGGNISAGDSAMGGARFTVSLPLQAEICGLWTDEE